MGRVAAALVGALSGALVGVVLLVTTHPTSAYLNDAYREGASIGFVARYVTLGVVAALLLGIVRRHRVLAGIGLAAVLCAAILPPALDDQTESEKRKAEAVAEDDPVERDAAEFRAGLIDGCVTRTRRDLEGTPEEEGLDADAYCTCLIDAVVVGPGRSLDEMQTILSELQSSGPSPEMQQAMTRCSEEAQGK